MSALSSLSARTLFLVALGFAAAFGLAAGFVAGFGADLVVVYRKQN
jgi:hypothetical protein